jgi:hypothetical protein
MTPTMWFIAGWFACWGFQVLLGLVFFTFMYHSTKRWEKLHGPR